MQRRTFSHFIAGSLGAGLLGGHAAVRAQAPFPSKNITLVYPWPPGGPGDVLSRLYAQKCGQRLNETIVVDTRPGATGAIGLSFAARAAADGYTLALASVDTHAINPNFNDKITYKALEDFKSVGGVGRIPMALCVNAQGPYKDMAGFVAAAKAKPQSLTYASWGNGSLAHVTMALVARQAGIEAVHVPYQGAAPALTGMIGGQVDAMVLPFSMAWANAQGGKIRILGTTTIKRVAQDIPTLAEQGLPVEVHNWFGLVVPSKTPAAIIGLLSKETLAVVKQTDWAEALKPHWIEPYPATAEEFDAMVLKEHQRWKTIMSELNIKQV